jgi:hypothetical protein
VFLLAARKKKPPLHPLTVKRLGLKALALLSSKLVNLPR